MKMSASSWIGVTALACLWWSAGCLGPLVSDTIAVSYLAAGEVVPSVAEDAALAAQIEANDGVSGELGYTLGFAGGASVAYWDLGPVIPTSVPMYVLMDRDTPLAGHPPIIDAVPGDSAYRRFCAVYTVDITGRYGGERIPSLRALQDAAVGNDNLVGNPQPTGTVQPCPVVHSDVTLRAPDGSLRTPQTAYYKGYEVTLFLFAGIEVAEGAVEVPTMPYFRLRREGGEPLSEPHRRVDMTGDGDTSDSNDVLFAAPGAAGFSNAMRRVNVVVGADYKSIDSSGSDTVADYMAGADLFATTAEGALDPVVGNVVAWEPQEGVSLMVTP